MWSSSSRCSNSSARSDPVSITIPNCGSVPASGSRYSMLSSADQPGVPVSAGSAVACKRRDGLTHALRRPGPSRRACAGFSVGHRHDYGVNRTERLIATQAGLNTLCAGAKAIKVDQIVPVDAFIAVMRS